MGSSLACWLGRPGAQIRQLVKDCPCGRNVLGSADLRPGDCPRQIQKVLHDVRRTGSEVGPFEPHVITDPLPDPLKFDTFLDKDRHGFSGMVCHSDLVLHPIGSYPLIGLFHFQTLRDYCNETVCILDHLGDLLWRRSWLRRIRLSGVEVEVNQDFLEP